MKAYIPANLDLQKMLNDDPPSFDYDIDNFHYIFSTLIQMKAQHKDYEDQEYLPLSSTLLQEKIRTYNKHLQYLIQKGALQTDGQYIVGKKARGYKIAPEYAKADVEKVNIKKSALTKPKPTEQKKLDSFNAQYGYLTQWFNKKLRINEKMCYGWIMSTAHREYRAGVKGVQKLGLFV